VEHSQQGGAERSSGLQGRVEDEEEVMFVFASSDEASVHSWAAALRAQLAKKGASATDDGAT
jgi:hypothetical protein